MTVVKPHRKVKCTKCGKPKEGHPTRTITFQGKILTCLYHPEHYDEWKVRKT